VRPAAGDPAGLLSTFLVASPVIIVMLVHVLELSSDLPEAIARST
jgi:hypothetical protein